MTEPFSVQSWGLEVIPKIIVHKHCKSKIPNYGLDDASDTYKKGAD